MEKAEQSNPKRLGGHITRNRWKVEKRGDCYNHQPEQEDAGEGTWTPEWEVIVGEETTQFHGELWAPLPWFSGLPEAQNQKEWAPSEETKVHVSTDPTELRLEKAAGRQESSKNPWEVWKNNKHHII